MWHCGNEQGGPNRVCLTWHDGTTVGVKGLWLYSERNKNPKGKEEDEGEESYTSNKDERGLAVLRFTPLG